MSPAAWLGAGVALMVALFVGSGYLARRGSEQRRQAEHERSLSLAASATKAAEERQAIQNTADEARRVAEKKTLRGRCVTRRRAERRSPR